jgi:hypothetical protein
VHTPQSQSTVNYYLRVFAFVQFLILWELNLLLKLVEIVERNRPSVRNSQRISSDFYHLHIVRSKHRISHPFLPHINNRPFEPPSYRIWGQTYGLPNLHLKLSFPVFTDEINRKRPYVIYRGIVKLKSHTFFTQLFATPMCFSCSFFATPT